jgi:hypothetical protein
MNEGADAPSGVAVVSLWNKALLVNQRAVPARAPTNRAWMTVDTEPNVVRNGYSEMVVAFANPTNTPAEMRLMLFDTAGVEKGRYVQILPPHMQQKLTLAEMFNVTRFEGSVRLWSDVPLGVSPQRTTKSVRNELVETQIDYLKEETLQGKRSVAIPGVMDGEGMSTQVVFANPTEAPMKDSWKFLSTDGAAIDVVMR